MDRSNVRLKGAPTYNPAKPCRRGHLAARLASNKSCTECNRIYGKAYTQRNYERVLKFNREYRAQNPERVKQWTQKQRREKLPEIRARCRAYHRKKLGCPLPTREAPEFCELCGKLPDGKAAHSQVLVLDHDHFSGKFRGWICGACNLGLGKLGDTVEALELALAYLRRAQ